MKAMTAETELRSLVERLFKRWPMLAGFSVQDTGELLLADVETNPWSAAGPELSGEIAVALLDFIDEDPAARELVRGRTFVRTLH
jgi:hypothetical protein